MTDSFFQRWVNKLSGRPVTGPPRRAETFAGAFGKHPAWDDHIPDLGMEHPILVELKRTFYEGITGNVENGQWDKLEQAHTIEPYAHSLLYRFIGGAVFGRLWYSRDGKGRDRYPMGVVLLWLGALDDKICRQLCSYLEQVQPQFEKAATAKDVQQALEGARQFAAELSAKSIIPSAGTGERELGTSLIDCQSLGPDRQGLLRVLYHLERELAIKLATAHVSRSRGGPVMTAALRVPSCASNPCDASIAWTEFVCTQADWAGPVLALAPDHGRWVDLMIGKPGVSHLYCIRAPVEAVPYTSEIPYTLDPQFLERAAQSLDRRRAVAGARG